MTLATEPKKPRIRVKAGSRPSEEHAFHSAARNSANTENDHVDGSAPRAGHAGQSDVYALSGQVEPRNSDEETFDENASLAAREGEKPLHSNSNSSATSSRQTDTAGTDRPPFVPATIPQRKPLRPHCLNPELCAGSGSNHCHACRKALAGRADGGIDITMKHLNIAGAA
jgi:hypothetical protein